MEVEIGDKVKFINENLEGKITNIISETILLVSCSDGFDYEVSINEIIIVGENNEQSYHVDETEISSKIIPTNIGNSKKGLLSKYTETSKYKLENILEIDLHLEELVEFPEKLDNWHKLHTQMTHVKNCLDAAFNKNIKKIVFIHGVGTGVLKTELKNYLANFDNIIIKDADFREYGVGATEVVIKN